MAAISRSVQLRLSLDGTPEQAVLVDAQRDRERGACFRPMGYSLAPGGKRLSRRTELHANRISKASEEAEYPTLVDITARLAVAEAEVGAVALLPPASLRAKSSADAPEQDRSDVGRAHQARFDGQVDLFSGFLLAMGAGVMMVFAVLVLLFGSFLHPLTILFSLPLSIGGGSLACS